MPLKFQVITDQQLKKLAVDMYNDEVFIAKNDKELKMVFLPIAFGMLNDITDEEINSIGMIYEYMTEMSGIINGLPVFHSMYILSNEQVEILSKYFIEYDTLQKQFLTPEN